MLVTIFADASYFAAQRAGGWACWVKSQRGHVDHSGKIKAKIATSEHAEMIAIVNAIVVAKLARVALPGDKLLIQSDCIGAMEGLKRLLPGLPRYRSFRQPILDGYRQQIEGFEVEFRHVRGHTKTADARSYVNKVCDKAARRQGRQAKKGKKHEVQAGN